MVSFIILAWYILWSVTSGLLAPVSAHSVPWATRPLSQRMLYWWKANGNTVNEAFLCVAPIHCRTRGWTGRMCRFSGLRCGQTGIRSQPTNICGARSIPRPVIPLKNRLATVVTLTLSSHNFPTDRARELFKPFEEQVS